MERLTSVYAIKRIFYETGEFVIFLKLLFRREQVTCILTFHFYILYVNFYCKTIPKCLLVLCEGFDIHDCNNFLRGNTRSKNYFTDDLIKAREKCKKAESDSEILTEVEENGKKKRKRKVINYDSDDESNQETEKQIKIKYPVHPKIHVVSVDF